MPWEIFLPTADSRLVTAETALSTMHAAVYKGASVVAVESLPVPEIGPGEVLIRVESCGICPTDLKKIAYNLLPGPRIYGHETAGVIAAVGAGIPVITIDSDARGSKRLFFIGTNNLEAGRLGGHRVIERLGGAGNVVFFIISGQPNMEERLKGFKDVLGTRPNIHIVDVVDIKSDARAAFDKTQELMALTGPKKIDAFVCLESASGKMVSDAVKRTNTNDRLVVAWDVNQDTLDGIKGGTINATVAQKPFTMGYIGLKALDEIFHSPPTSLAKDYSSDAFSPFPEFIDTGTSLVDKNNVDAYIETAAAHQ